MYDGLNVGKRNVTLNLKHPDAVALVRRLVVEWADAVAENFAPRAMRGFGLDYDSLAALKPDLVMVSACLNGQTGPHRDYPGFGGQGSALAGYNALTGWPDREPVGPCGTITDSLAPRFVATALAAALLYRRRTGRGVYLDVSQVESAIYSLAPWLLDYERDGVIRLRDGNRHAGAVPHGAFPCADEAGVGDRWVAIACWTDDQWDAFARVDRSSTIRRSRRSPRARRAIDEVEALVAGWTRTRRPPRRRRTAPGGRHRGGTGRGLRRPARRPAAREPRPLRAAPPRVPRRRPLRAQRLPALASRRRATTAPARRSARTPTGCSPTCSASTPTRSPGCARRARSSSAAAQYCRKYGRSGCARFSIRMKTLPHGSVEPGRAQPGDVGDARRRGTSRRALRAPSRRRDVVAHQADVGEAEREHRRVGAVAPTSIASGTR